MSWLRGCAGLILGCFGSAALGGPAEGLVVQDRARTPRSLPRVLVYTVSAGFEHDVVRCEKGDELSLVERALVDLGKRTGDFEAVVTRDARDFTPAKLAEVDLVFFYTTGELPLSPEEREALLAYVRNGGAFAGSHCATDTFYQVPEYGQMIGAYFDGHPMHRAVLPGRRMAR